MKLCGSCRYHDPQRRICAINMAYQAFVYVDTLAHNCPSWEAPRADGGVAQQSQCRAVDAPADPLYFMGVQVVNQP